MGKDICIKGPSLFPALVKAKAMKQQMEYRLLRALDQRFEERRRTAARMRELLAQRRALREDVSFFRTI